MNQPGPPSPWSVVRRAVARWPWPSLALLCCGVTLVHSWSSGRLQLLMAPVFHGLVIGAGLMLLVWSVTALVVDPPRRSTPWRAAVLVVCTSLLMVLAPPRSSFSTLARYRPPARLDGLAAGFALPPEQRDLVDWVRLLRGTPQPQLFRGEPVQVEGFVLVTATGEHHLAQLLVRCCLADATPVWLAVQWPANATPPQDQWVRVEGQMELLDTPSGMQPVVVAHEVTAIAKPRQPFRT
ncbi:MAG: TIGR03943 family protein [Synechococcus sp. SB0673_bin_10]|uniref:TIGR03943 family protein n=1 Tax=Synechococcus sp. SB0676_bin_10 TaxID=2604869 RepID=A0A6B1F9Q0_9SYNE|nr:TIGR03943 family protein [Cyanobacteria bacterium MAG IRC3_bin_20]MDE0646867.1 TIGR03943 family protein [Cyanobacteria bacterium MAG IRC4_bin_6]MXX08813.1 TIGR03943 family protein [Synechococcus sp. SB0667_bin_8]MXY62718.1 TIGR03943 family protein [Synechococcus sp. SB0665_bin_28]MYF20518.1 TIGR03943 family protein [Synechococcus sp. SB0677_bin_5]MYG38456.1 TIGR03943 family protein [Synechococcus sp. SB0676_bin_10]MYG63419.1 TIGR03943 family protein [Synechococcus sp. SB0675_bin_7]MYI7229